MSARRLSVLVVVMAFAWAVLAQVHIGGDAKSIAERARAHAEAVARTAEANRALIDKLEAALAALPVSAPPAEVAALRSELDVVRKRAEEPGPPGPPGPAGSRGPVGPAGAAAATTSSSTSTSTRPPPPTSSSSSTTTTTRRATTTSTRRCPIKLTLIGC